MKKNEYTDFFKSFKKKTYLLPFNNFSDLEEKTKLLKSFHEKRIKKHCELLNKNGIRFEIISGYVYIDLHSLTQKQIDYWVLKSVNETKNIEKKYSELGIKINT
jgi:hypothetical protein